MTTVDPLELVRDANPVPDPARVSDPAAKARMHQQIVDVPISHPPPRPTHRKRHVIAALVGVSAIAFALTVQQNDTGNPALPGVVSALADASQAPGSVLHTVDDGPHVPDASGGPAIERQETWEATDGAVQRTLTRFADGNFQDLRLERRDGKYQVQVFSSKTNELQIGSWLDDTTPPGAGTSYLGVDSIREYAQAVDAGHARVDGEATIKGHVALRVVDTQDGPAGGTVWYVAKNDAEPSLLRIQPPCRGEGGSCPEPTTYATYEVLQSNEALDLPTRPGARIIRGG